MPWGAMADLGTGLHQTPGGAPPIGVGLGRYRRRCAELWRGELLLADRCIRPCSLLCVVESKCMHLCGHSTRVWVISV